MPEAIPRGVNPAYRPSHYRQQFTSCHACHVTSNVLEAVVSLYYEGKDKAFERSKTSISVGEKHWKFSDEKSKFYDCKRFFCLAMTLFSDTSIPKFQTRLMSTEATRRVNSWKIKMKSSRTWN